MKKLCCLVFLLPVVWGVYAQAVNTYKYIVIPKKFEVLKDTNQHQLNVLTKMLFEEAGFEAVYDDDLPDDLELNNCLGLHAKLEDDSGMFTTKLRIKLEDCKENVIFTSAEGRSRKKDYRQAHQEALRIAFRSIKRLNYKYTPEAKPLDITAATKNGVQVKPASENTSEPVKKTAVTPNTKALYAQSVANGFQLVDSTPKVVYVIQSTNLKDVYIIKDKNGILYKNGATWTAEYYREGTLVRETVTVKF